MNINLSTTNRDNISIQAEIEQHQRIMLKAGYKILAPAILVPEPGVDADAYPGSYQVWSPIVGGDEWTTAWVYVDSEGVTINRTSEQMIEAVTFNG